MGPIVSLAERRERRRRGRGLREASCRACVAEHVRNELRSLAPRARWTASDWALHTAALHVDLARLRRFAGRRAWRPGRMAVGGRRGPGRATVLKPVGRVIVLVNGLYATKREERYRSLAVR